MFVRDKRSQVPHPKWLGKINLGALGMETAEPRHAASMTPLSLCIPPPWGTVEGVPGRGSISVPQTPGCSDNWGVPCPLGVQRVGSVEKKKLTQNTQNASPF